MTDRLLNIVSALQDENRKFDVELSLYEPEGFDYTLTCRRYYETGKDIASFDFDPVLDHEGEFDRLAVSSHTRDEGPVYCESVSEGISQFVVEIRVKE